MGFPTKVQLIKRPASEQWYINFPSALAQAMEFTRGETVEWFVEDKGLLALRRGPSATRDLQTHGIKSMPWLPAGKPSPSPATASPINCASSAAPA